MPILTGESALRLFLAHLQGNAVKVMDPDEKSGEFEG